MRFLLFLFCDGNNELDVNRGRKSGWDSCKKDGSANIPRTGSSKILRKRLLRPSTVAAYSMIHCTSTVHQAPAADTVWNPVPPEVLGHGGVFVNSPSDMSLPLLSLTRFTLIARAFLGSANSLNQNLKGCMLRILE